MTDITLNGLLVGYLLLIIPLGAILWLGVPLLGRVVIAVLRMSVQLLFVGLYLQVVFEWDNPWLNALWLLVMISVADISILHHCNLRVRRLVWPLSIALLVGTAIPLLFFELLILSRPTAFEARFIIPIGGMILGNCMRADIIGFRHFYESIHRNEKSYLHALSLGATLHEATRPHLRQALEAAISPTLATMATIGLVSLPGMMTGVILGGQDPSQAVMYQLAIMLAIFAGSTLTVTIGILICIKTSFNQFGVLDRSVFQKLPTH